MRLIIYGLSGVAGNSCCSYNHDITHRHRQVDVLTVEKPDKLASCQIDKSIFACAHYLPDKYDFACSSRFSIFKSRDVCRDQYDLFNCIYMKDC